MKKVIIIGLLAVCCQVQVNAQSNNESNGQSGVSKEDMQRRQAYLQSDEYKATSAGVAVNAVPPTVAPTKEILDVSHESATVPTLVQVKPHAGKVADRVPESTVASRPDQAAQMQTNSLGNSSLPTARDTRDTQKEAEIRERIKAATSNGAPGKR